MSDWNSVDFTQQGWQCPVCKRVYSPTTPMCYYCGNGITVSGTAVGDAVIDRINREFVQKAEKPEDGR